MEFTTYKEIKIMVEREGQFTAEGIKGWYDTFDKVKRQIDKVLKAETSKNFPIEVISSDMQVGRITSMNTYTGYCWFVRVGGRRSGERSKEQTIDYRGQPKFFTPNEANIKIIQRYREIEEAVSVLSKEQRTLEKGLTEPIVFPTTEDDTKA